MSSIVVLLLCFLRITSLLTPSPVDINSAGEFDLLALPGIGPVRAAAIIEYREQFGPFLCIDDIQYVRGIGPSTLEHIRELIIVGNSDGALADTLHWLDTVCLRDTLLTLTFLDIGNGDATLIEAREGETWLLDGGPDNGGPLVAPAAARLIELGVDSIDVVVFTHPHADHIGGLSDVLKTVVVGTVLDPGMEFNSWVYENLLNTILESSADYELLYEGDRYELSKHVSIEVIHSSDGNQVDLNLNEASAVFLLTCGNFSALFAGDIEEDTEIELTGHIDPVTMMIAPHHGSRTSAFPPFIRKLRPQLAVFSAGRNNPFGHPHPEVVEAYVALHAEILRTDRLGTIVVHTDGRNIQFSSSMRGSSP